jgi:transposase
LEEQIILFKQRQFGKSSEKSDQQAELFDEVGREGEASGRKPLPAVLPRVRIEHDLAEADKHCACGCVKTCIGEDTSEQLDIIPAVVQVLIHARKKYACKACESGVNIAELPKQPRPKSNVSRAYSPTLRLANIKTAYRSTGWKSFLNEWGFIYRVTP